MSIEGLSMNSAATADSIRNQGVREGWYDSGSAYQYSDDVSSMMNTLMDIRDYDNIWSANEAAKQRDWSSLQAELTRQFNASEAAKNRDFQLYMSDTAHQRETRDLLAAGLNPVLSALNGNGAAVTSGSAASSSSPSGSSANGNQSTGMAIANILATMLSNQTKMAETMINAELTEKLTEKQLAQNAYLTLQGYDLTKYGYDIGAQNAKTAAAASMYNASTAAAASMYSSDKAYELGYNKAWMEYENNNLQREWQEKQNSLDRLHDINMQEDRQQWEHDEANLHPKNAYDAALIAGNTAIDLLGAIKVPVSNSTLQAANRYAMSDKTPDDWEHFLNSINY